jgi:plasmid maintenance system antidote protein VapI
MVAGVKIIQDVSLVFLSPEVWMGMQADYELRIAQRTIGPEVEKRVHRHAA